MEPGNLKQITEALEKFVNSPELIKQLGAESYNLVPPFFPDMVFEHLKKIYLSLL